MLMEVNAPYRLRSAQGVVHLADKHDAERLNAARRPGRTRVPWPRSPLP